MNGFEESFGFDPVGNRTNMMDMSGSTAYTYDSRNRLQLKTETWRGGPLISLNYAYDLNGNVTNIWSSSTGGVNLRYAFDALNRITNVLANGAQAASYGFDLNGNLQSIRYGNGITNLCQYDALNHLTNSIWNSNQLALATFYYQLGKTGNRTSLTETLLTSVTNRTYAWSYDSLYRLTNEVISGFGGVSYGLDNVGNRTNRTITGSLNLTNQTFNYNTNDWLGGDTYDPNGNTTGSSGNSYQYDQLNRLTNANNGPVVIWYNADGQRVKKIVGGITTLSLVDSLNPSGYSQVLEELTVSGGVANLSRAYTYGLALISQRQPNVSTNWYVADGHGSIRLLLDPTGVITDSYTYDSYGNLIASTGTTDNHYLYYGGQWDSDLGMYYSRARYFNPQTGRFWTEDDDGHSDQDEPRSLHLYTCCEADPVDNTDPSGHDIGEMLAVSGDFAALDATLNVSVSANAAAGFRLGIGVEPPIPAAIYKGVLNVSVDPGHTFVYVKQAGVVVSILSFGPTAPIGRNNKKQFLGGTLPGNAHWPILVGTIDTWEIPISAFQMQAEKQAISNFKSNVPNYTPQMQCTSAVLSVAAKSGVKLPRGVGPVVAKDYFTFWSGNVPNPYELKQEMSAAHGPPAATSSKSFPKP